mmetsp:Transcript_20099/g.58340  ORF Transcript_20099/g.58340 Transcript_20099/m.58340 type:complete len:332 (+) Transcript_20099:265-1260(+)
MFQSAASPWRTRSSYSRFRLRDSSRSSNCSRRASAIWRTRTRPLVADALAPLTCSSTARPCLAASRRPSASPSRSPSRSAISISSRSVCVASRAAAVLSAASASARCFLVWNCASCAFRFACARPSSSCSCMSHCVCTCSSSGKLSLASLRNCSGTCLGPSVPWRATSQRPLPGSWLTSCPLAPLSSGLFSRPPSTTSSPLRKRGTGGGPVSPRCICSSVHSLLDRNSGAAIASWLSAARCASPSAAGPCSPCEPVGALASWRKLPVGAAARFTSSRAVGASQPKGAVSGHASSTCLCTAVTWDGILLFAPLFSIRTTLNFPSPSWCTSTN